MITKKYLVKIRVFGEKENIEKEIEVDISGHIHYEGLYLKAALEKEGIEDKAILLGYKRIRKEDDYG